MPGTGNYCVSLLLCMGSYELLWGLSIGFLRRVLDWLSSGTTLIQLLWLHLLGIRPHSPCITGLSKYVARRIKSTTPVMAPGSALPLSFLWLLFPCMEIYHTWPQSDTEVDLIPLQQSGESSWPRLGVWPSIASGCVFWSWEIPEQCLRFAFLHSSLEASLTSCVIAWLTLFVSSLSHVTPSLSLLVGKGCFRHHILFSSFKAGGAWLQQHP